MNNQSKIFFLAVMMTAAASSIFFSTINNYLYESFNINASGRGVLEFFRELPGLLTFLFVAIMAFVREKYVMIIASLLGSISFFCLSMVQTEYSLVILFIFLWSIGAHINMAMQYSYGVALSSIKKRGKLFGVVGGVRGAGMIIGTLIVWIGMGKLNFHFSLVYKFAGVFLLLAGLFYSMLQPKEHTALKRRKIVLRKKYIIFYILSVLFGVRKQIFLVFAPWLLVKIFSVPTHKMGLLFFLAALFGLFLKPVLGLCIDRFGERNVLMADSIILFCVCLGYIFVPHLFDVSFAIPILYALFIMDDLLFSLRSAHTTYLSKIIKQKDELTATISISIAIDHSISMIGPIFAGIIWLSYGFEYVFAICAFFAILMFFTVMKIPSKKDLLAMAT